MPIWIKIVKRVCVCAGEETIYYILYILSNKKDEDSFGKKKYMNRNAITALLFLFGSLIFTLDSIFYIIENAQNHHGYLYCVGSIAFSIGSYISYTTTTQQK